MVKDLKVTPEDKPYTKHGLCNIPRGGSPLADGRYKNMGADTMGESNTPDYLGGHLPQTGHVEEDDGNQLD